MAIGLGKPFKLHNRKGCEHSIENHEWLYVIRECRIMGCDNGHWRIEPFPFFYRSFNSTIIF